MKTNPANLIICDSHKQTPGQKILGLFLPVLFWGMLLYMLFLLGTLCFWIVVDAPFGKALNYQDILAIKTVLSRYFPTIGCAVCIFLLWALYNKLRFHGHRNRRRTPALAVSLNETAEFGHLHSDDIHNMQQAKTMTCLFDDEGNIVDIRFDITILPDKKTSYQNRPVITDTILNERMAI